MSVCRQQVESSKQHREAHNLGIIPRFVAIYCTFCYSPPEESSLPIQFQHFWAWINQNCSALTYTRYTVTTFNVFITIFSSEPVTNNIVTNRLTDFTYRIIGSLTYSSVPPEKHLVYHLINLTVQTDYFQNPVNLEEFHNLQTIVNYSLRYHQYHQEFEDYYN